MRSLERVTTSEGKREYERKRRINIGESRIVPTPQSQVRREMTGRGEELDLFSASEEDVDRQLELLITRRQRQQVDMESLHLLPASSSDLLGMEACGIHETTYNSI